jgi:hypothetical protein
MGFETYTTIPANDDEEPVPFEAMKWGKDDPQPVRTRRGLQVLAKGDWLIITRPGSVLVETSTVFERTYRSA